MITTNNKQIVFVVHISLELCSCVCTILICYAAFVVLIIFLRFTALLTYRKQRKH